MDKKKEIEKLATRLHGNACGGNCSNKQCCCEDFFKAQKVINWGYGNVEQYQNEIKQLKSKIAKLEEFYKIVQSYYEDLDSLAKRLQDDYNGEKSFEQEESDRLGICYILDHIDEMGRLD